MSRRVKSIISEVEIGDRLRKLRLSRKMTMMTLAEVVDVSYQQIQKYEVGANRMSASTLRQISIALKADMSEFFPPVELETRPKEFTIAQIQIADHMEAMSSRKREALRNLILAM